MHESNKLTTTTVCPFDAAHEGGHNLTAIQTLSATSAKRFSSLLLHHSFLTLNHFNRIMILSCLRPIPFAYMLDVCWTSNSVCVCVSVLLNELFHIDKNKRNSENEKSELNCFQKAQKQNKTKRMKKTRAHLSNVRETNENFVY